MIHVIFQSVLNGLCGRVFISSSYSLPPRPQYIGFSTTAPTIDAENITEPESSTGYKRIPIGTMTTDGDGVAYNVNEIIYDGAIEPIENIKWLVIFSTVTRGTPLMAEQLAEPMTINPGETLILRPGSIKLSFGELKVNL